MLGFQGFEPNRNQVAADLRHICNSPAPTDAALVEALRFVIAKELVSTFERDPQADSWQTLATMQLSLVEIRGAALSVLVDRLGYDPGYSRRAISRRFAPKREHREPSFVPSIRPDKAAQRARAG